MAKFIGFLLSVLVFVTLLVYLGLLGASHVYIAGGGFAETVGSNMNPIWEIFKSAQALNLPELNDFGPIHVDKVTGFHAVRNAFFILCWTFLAALFPLFCVALALFGILSGIFMAKWENFLLGLLMVVMVPLSVFIVGLDIIFTWFALLLQPSTQSFL